MQSIWSWALPGIVLVLVLVLVALLYLKFVRAPSPRDDRYTSEALLTPAQADLLVTCKRCFRARRCWRTYR
ncbi:hypothetical protein [Rhodoferax sediminis]|uniref:Uncharacterized protein n=1 Tax=Rhodoferax sediminis TaxID=2509614 RepID=A0A515D7C3_9BURK|nr:hypothetical protein [Rhodoferax sediminis]QDL36312.1 hypothetical protein EUB48_02605 [Rhodoferax sediminis]